MTNDNVINRQQCIDVVNKILAQYVPKIYLYSLPLELEKAITDLPSVSVAINYDSIKEMMIKYGFCAPDMTVAEFIEDILPSVSVAEKTQMIDKSNFDEEQYRADLQCAYECGENSGTEKVGRWEWVQYDFDPRIGNWHCSECRNILVCAVKKDDVGGIPIAKYCPNCGAKMGVVKEWEEKNSMRMK